MKILRAIPFVGMAVFVLGALPVNAQVNVSSERSGTCVSADEQHRTEWFFPSNNGYYSNVQAIGLTEGSGADVTWHYFEAIAATAGIDVGAVFTLNGTSYLPSGESSCWLTDTNPFLEPEKHIQTEFQIRKQEGA